MEPGLPPPQDLNFLVQRYVSKEWSEKWVQKYPRTGWDKALYMTETNAAGRVTHPTLTADLLDVFSVPPPEADFVQ